jgi:hypothetical protein
LADNTAFPWQLPWWQAGIDVTAVGSTLSPGTVSAGVGMRLGRIDLAQGGVRAGVRWRERVRTPVVTFDGVHVSMFRHGQTLLAVSVAGAMTVTDIPKLVTMDWNLSSALDSNVVPVSYHFTRVTKQRAVISDATLRLQVNRGTWDIGASTTARAGKSVNVWDEPVAVVHYNQSNDRHYAAMARVAWTPVSKFTIAAEGGRQLGNPAFGLAGVRYATVSLRYNFSNRSPFSNDDVLSPRARRNDNELDETVSVGAPRSDGSRLFTLEEQGDTTVEIAADFTQWKTVHLTPCSSNTPQTGRSNDDHSVVRKWCGHFAIASGVYHVIYRRNGSEWLVPDGLSAVDDTFGGKVGLLIIP